MSDEYQERYLAHQRRKREVLISLINERHSTRTFSEEPVGEALDDLLRAGERAPSSCDRRGVAIHVVADRDSKALLGGVLVGGVGWVHRAPVVLLFMADPQAYKAGDEVTYMPYLDTGAIVGQMYLAVTALGLRCCFINPNIRESNKKHFHGTFGPGIFCGALAVGHPRQLPEAGNKPGQPPLWVWDTA